MISETAIHQTTVQPGIFLADWDPWTVSPLASELGCPNPEHAGRSPILDGCWPVLGKKRLWCQGGRISGLLMRSLGVVVQKLYNFES